MANETSLRARRSYARRPAERLDALRLPVPAAFRNHGRHFGDA
ncbi:MAG: hypothetical protein ABR915_03915 [Thermoguttaceae bacterium]